MPVAGRIVYEFSGFRLDPLQRSLVTVADNRTVVVTSKALDALLFFVEHPGELLDKQRLMLAVWPNVVVEDNNLNQIISALRKALGDTPGDHRFIATVPGRGYRFVAEVMQGPAAPAVSPRDASALPPASTAATRLPERGSIAVLPFVNLTGDPAKEYMSDGLAEELIGTLGRIGGLRVPARTSSFAYKGRNVDVRQVARDLEVAVVLEGAVRSAGERVRATAQLVDGTSGYQLWSQSYDRNFTDLFALQDDLATSIVRAVSDHLQVELPSIGQVSPTRDLQAYQWYLQARSLISRASADNLRTAGLLLHRAIEHDAGFAQAWSELGRSHLYLYMGSFSFDPAELDRAEDAAQQALSLDPGLGGARALIAQVAARRGNWLNARRCFRDAVASDPDEPALRISHATFLNDVGQLRASLSEVRAADRLAPGFSHVSLLYAIVYSVLAVDAEAVRYAEQATNLGLSRHPGVSVLRAHAAYRQGCLEAAATHGVRALPVEVQEAGGTEAVRLVYAALRDTRETPTAIDALGAMGKSTAGANSSMKMMLMMHWYTMLGALDQAYETAFAGLARLRGMGTVGGAVWVGLWIPEMRPFRQHSSFQTLVDALDLTDYWCEYGPPDGYELRDGRLVTVAGSA